MHKWLRIPYTLHVRYEQRPPKPVATLLFIHGIGNSGDAWKAVTDKIPDTVRIISIDLLGFGVSPSPKWATYNARTQARSVLATLVRLRLRTPIIIVGHSLGALVAIEIAKRYPLIVRRLVLCSPPLYTINPIDRINRDTLLKKSFVQTIKHPETFVKLSSFAMKYKLINNAFNVTDENVDSYMAALGTMIINQTSLNDAEHLTVPTTIIRGTLDPFIIPKNLTELASRNPNITVKTIIAGHEIRGQYIRPLVKIIMDILPVDKKDAINK